MTPDPRSLLAATGARPTTLYRYSQRSLLERSLQFGEFALRPGLRPDKAFLSTVDPIMPFGAPVSAHTLLTLSLSSSPDESLYDRFDGADCCLVINHPEEFGERLHRAVQRLLPHWAGIDAAVSYGAPSGLGAVFSKGHAQATEKEWLFAWRTAQAGLDAQLVLARIGSLESIASLRSRA